MTAKAMRLTRAGFIARTLFAEAFLDHPSREPRSYEYKQGVLDTLDFLEAGRANGLACPYEAGTASADAWHAGVAEGRWRWRRWEDLNREG